MSNITIKKFRVFDLADFTDLYDKNDPYYPQISMSISYLRKHEIYRNNCCVAYDDSTLVGYAYGSAICDTLYPQFIYVRKEYRKQGIGKKLMEFLEQNCNCSVSMVYYHKELRTYYQKQEYTIGTNLEEGMKIIYKTT